MSSRRWSDSKFGGLVHNKKSKDQSGKLQEEKMEAILWINHTLADAGHLTYSIKDLSRDLSDGVVLAKLIEYITGEAMLYHIRCSSHKEKLENIQNILSVVTHKGVSMADIDAEDVVRGNLKVTLNLCHKIRQGLAVRGKEEVSSNWSTGSSQIDAGSTGMVLSASQPVNKSLLVWAGNVLHRNIIDYSELRDGRVLCELMNALQIGVISPAALMSDTSPQKCFSLALYTAEKYFGISIGHVDIIQIIKGGNDNVIQLLLQHLRDVWSHKADSTAKSVANPRPTNGSIQQDKFGRVDHLPIGYDNNTKQSMSPPRHNVDPNHSSQMSKTHNYDEPRLSHLQRMGGIASHSTGHLNTYSTQRPNPSSYNTGSNSPAASVESNTTRTSNGGSGIRQRVGSVGELVPDSSIKGFSSYRQPDAAVTPTSTKPFRHSVSNPAFSQTLQQTPKQDTWMGGASPRHSVPVSSSTVEYSFASDLPMPVMYRTSSRTSIHSTSSRSSLDDQQHITLANLSNTQSSIPSHMISPEYQTERSLRDSYRRNSNGGGSGGGGGGTGTTTATTDSSGQLLDELNKRITDLTELMNEERNALKIFKTIARENARRQRLEKQFTDYIKLSKVTIRRYESCLVHLGKEVSRISTELNTMKGHVSAVSTLENDVIRLNAEMARLSSKVELTQHQYQHQQNHNPPTPEPHETKLNPQVLSDQLVSSESVQKGKVKSSRSSIFSKKKN